MVEYVRSIDHERVLNHLRSFETTGDLAADLRRRAGQIETSLLEDHELVAYLDTVSLAVASRMVARFEGGELTELTASAFELGFLMGTAFGLDAATAWELD
ncbi:MAG: hypothetical protein JHD02_07045 [Thermoleophilaceae bacterium]|nr:hypothetical protein [Thermoleophilaceae bacterium]